MNQQIYKNHWLSLRLSLLSLGLVLMTAPAPAASPFAHLGLAPAPAPAFTSANGLEQGRTFYQAGQYQAAIAIWQTTAEQFQTQGDRSHQALTLSYLSLAYQALHQWEQAQQTIHQSLELLRAATPPAPAIVWAQALNTQASLHHHTGNGEIALETWKQSQMFYEQARDPVGSLGSQINQAQALQSLGFYRRSQQQLNALTQQLATMPDSDVKVNGLRSLAQTMQVMGDAEKSQQLLQQSLAIAQKLSAKPYLSSIFLNLGKTANQLNHANAALSYFNQAEQTATHPAAQLHPQLERFKLLLNFPQRDLATAAARQLLQNLQEQPPSRTSLYVAINFVAALQRHSHPAQILPLKDQSKLMSLTVQAARQLPDRRAEAHALTQWGHLYQRNSQWTIAHDLTDQALTIARQLQSEDIIAQAAWRLGQAYRQAGKRTEAIAAYTEAVRALKAMRTDLATIHTEVQFSFRESVEPVYREFVDLLLTGQPSQSALRQAREVIESLQIAELDNFFHEACLDKEQQIDQVDPSATVVYPIILPDRLVVIYSTAGQPLRYYATPASRAAIDTTLNRLLSGLNPVSDARDRDRASQQLYNWLIRPAETDQALQTTKTLVFVLDGRLRHIPVAALFDGKQYLIEKYAIALSPGLQLMGTKPLQPSQMGAIVAGISQSRSGFSALPAVEGEMRAIAQTIASTQLINQEFTNAALVDRVKNSNANIVHLATHGQFSSRQENTFLLTWDGRVSIQELAAILRKREHQAATAIELLVLSACDTAAGDDRAVLGLAGLAVKSGARSTIAALWPVKDRAAALLMTRFYHHLRSPGITKAAALQQAQVDLIRQTDFRDPFFWSAFVLVGHWL